MSMDRSMGMGMGMVMGAGMGRSMGTGTGTGVSLESWETLLFGLFSFILKDSGGLVRYKP